MMLAEQSANLKNARQLPQIVRHGEAWAKNSGAVVAEIRRTDWAARSELGLEVLSHGMVRRVLQGKEFRPAIREAIGGTDAPEAVATFLDDGMLPAFDGERHRRIRRVLLTAFAARQIDAQRQLMRAVAHRLIDSFIETGEADLVAQFTHRYPIEVVAGLIGVPTEDISLFERWTVAMGHLGDHPLGSGFSVAEEGIVGTVGYLENLVERRRAEPTDDLISSLLEAQALNGEISDSEVLYNMVNLLMAGHDTTRLQLASTVYLLLANPAQLDRLHAEPELAGNAIDEAMRLMPAVRHTYRFAREAMMLGDIAVEPDTLLVANIHAANLDGEMFPEPLTYDIGRSNAGEQLTFGLGAHLCAGAAVARAEMREALMILIERLDGLRLNGDPSFLHNGDNFGGCSSLPIAFTASAPRG